MPGSSLEFVPLRTGDAVVRVRNTAMRRERRRWNFIVSDARNRIKKFAVRDSDSEREVGLTKVESTNQIS